MKRYCGIGSRQTPGHILGLMVQVAEHLSSLGYQLRSGGAIGADTAFARGATDKVIYRPEHATPESINMASQFHPAWDKCNDYARKLHGRNALIIMGDDLSSPVDLVVCYTNLGQLIGGTALGIRIANYYGIPVLNMGIPSHLERIQKKLDGWKNTS